MLGVYAHESSSPKRLPLMVNTRNAAGSRQRKQSCTEPSLTG